MPYVYSFMPLVPIHASSGSCILLTVMTVIMHAVWLCLLSVVIMPLFMGYHAWYGGLCIIWWVMHTLKSYHAGSDGLSCLIWWITIHTVGDLSYRVMFVHTLLRWLMHSVGDLDDVDLMIWLPGVNYSDDSYATWYISFNHNPQVCHDCTVTVWWWWWWGGQSSPTAPTVSLLASQFLLI